MFQKEVAERHRRRAAHQGLRPPVGARPMAARAADRVRRPGPRLHAAAQGDLERRPLIAARRRRSPGRDAGARTVTAAAFGQRRKMLRASLKPLGVPVEALLAAPGSRRPPAPRNSPSPISARSPAPSTAAGHHRPRPVSKQRLSPRAVGDVFLALHFDEARDRALELEGAVAGGINFFGRHLGRGEQQGARLVKRIDQDIEPPRLVALRR